MNYWFTLCRMLADVFVVLHPYLPSLLFLFHVIFFRLLIFTRAVHHMM